MIRISAGSAASMGLISLKADVAPTTVYLLHGTGCVMHCAFCPQSRSGGGLHGRLGRITWPTFNRSVLPDGLRQAEAAGVRRICLQSVRDGGGPAALVQLLEQLKAVSSLPVSVSTLVESRPEAAAIFEAGAARVSIALDLANPDLFARYKGGSFQKKLRLLLDCAHAWPGRMSTHLICGLGETEAAAAALLDTLLRAGITIALFAFTPLKGTPLAGHPQPEPAAYRRLQTARYLLQHALSSLERFTFAEGKITSFGLPGETLAEILKDGEAFRTSGCPECNRPYYNEKPGGFIYNYPRSLTATETKIATGTVLSTIINNL
ncbi:MAG: radical SAM protein [Bacillota bacterium]